MGGENGAVGQVGFLLRQQALQPEQQRKAPPPLDRGMLVPVLNLGQCSIERSPPGRTRLERLIQGLALVDELLARENLSTRDRGRIGKRGGVTHGDKG